MPGEYRIVVIPDDAPEAVEQIGTKYKFWYGSTPKSLFKQGRVGTGENWAEKAVCEIARCLGIPCAYYELAAWKDKQGVVTPKFLPEGDRLVLGNEVLSKAVTGYDPGKKRSQSEHTVRVLMTVLDRTVEPPDGWVKEPPVVAAADVFVGYLMLDALVGNTDRHHENWGWISSPGGSIVLTPSFDHASSLGRELRDARRELLLSERDPACTLTHYVGRSRSVLFRNLKDLEALSPADAFFDAANMRPDAGKAWLSRLSEVDEARLHAVFDGFPHRVMTSMERTFACRLLSANRHTLLSRRGEIQ